MGALTYYGFELPTNPTDKDKRRHRREFDKWCAAENARIGRQRAITQARGGRARIRLHTALCDRAWELLDAGECGAADELLEFVPEPMARRLLDDFFGEDA